MKKKGFTLIELLAVIIVLGIIALIAVPAVTNIINESKEKAAKVSAINYAQSVENYLIIQDIKDYPTKLINGKTYMVANQTDLDILLDEENDLDMSNDIFLNNIIKINGEYPKDGYITINDLKISDAILVFNEYVIEYDSESENFEITGKYNSDPVEISLIKIESNQIDYMNANSFKLNLTVEPSSAKRRISWSSSDPSVATVDRSGNVTVLKKGNTKIIAQKGGISDTFYLYLDEASEPIISDTNLGSPIISSMGAGFDNKVEISYDDREDLIGYYSNDNGLTWKEYKEPFYSTSQYVKAKSVSKNTLIESNVAEKTLQITDTSLMPIIDGNIDTKVNITWDDEPKRVNIDSSIIGKNITIRLFCENSNKSRVRFYDENDNAIGDFIQFPQGTNNYSIKVPNNSAYLIIDKSSLHVSYIYEISANEMPKQVELKNYYPLLSKDGVVYGYNDIVLSTEVGKDIYYKIDDSSWIKYVEPLKIKHGETLISKIDYKNEIFVPERTFISKHITDEVTIEAYDNNLETIMDLTWDDVPKRINIAPNSEGKTLRITGYSQDDNVSYVSFYKEDGTLIEKKYLLKDIDNNDFIIPNETNYIYTAKDRTHFYKIKEISIID